MASYLLGSLGTSGNVYSRLPDERGSDNSAGNILTNAGNASGSGTGTKSKVKAKKKTTTKKASSGSTAPAATPGTVPAHSTQQWDEPPTEGKSSKKSGLWLLALAAGIIAST